MKKLGATLNPVGVKAGANAIAVPASRTEEAPRMLRGAVATSGIVIALYKLLPGKTSIIVRVYVPRLATPAGTAGIRLRTYYADHQNTTKLAIKDGWFRRF